MVAKDRKVTSMARLAVGSEFVLQSHLTVTVISTQNSQANPHPRFCSTSTLVYSAAMSFKRVTTYAATPATTRGISTKLSASGDRVIYTNGKTVVVSTWFTVYFLILTLRNYQIRDLKVSLYSLTL